jgi:predicted helicase
LSAFQSIGGISAADAWTELIPDEHNDWLGQRDAAFETYLLIGDKRNASNNVLFENYTTGAQTQRDAWCYNFSKDKINKNLARTAAYYNMQREEYASGQIDTDQAFVDNETKIS